MQPQQIKNCIITDTGAFCVDLEIYTLHGTDHMYVTTILKNGKFVTKFTDTDSRFYELALRHVKAKQVAVD